MSISSRDIAEAAARRGGGGRTSPSRKAWLKPGDEWHRKGFQWNSGNNPPPTRTKRSRVPVRGLPYTKEQPFFNPKARLDTSQVEDRRAQGDITGGNTGHRAPYRGRTRQQPIPSPRTRRY